LRIDGGITEESQETQEVVFVLLIIHFSRIKINLGQEEEKGN